MASNFNIDFKFSVDRKQMVVDCTNFFCHKLSFFIIPKYFSFVKLQRDKKKKKEKRKDRHRISPQNRDCKNCISRVFLSAKLQRDRKDVNKTKKKKIGIGEECLTRHDFNKGFNFKKYVFSLKNLQHVASLCGRYVAKIYFGDMQPCASRR